MSPRKLNVACSGLHALHFLHRTPRAELVAAFSPCKKETTWARQHLESHGVTLYMDYTEMLLHPGLDAVVIAVVTTKHAEQVIKAIEADKHVLCEKPLSTSVEVVSVCTASQIRTMITNS